jgi:hypothetical protein
VNPSDEGCTLAENAPAAAGGSDRSVALRAFDEQRRRQLRIRVLVACTCSGSGALDARVPAELGGTFGGT